VRAEDVRAAAAAVVVSLAPWLPFAFAVAHAACASTPTVPLTPERALCYANADQAAQARLDRECVTPDGTPVPALECQYLDDILAELAAAQEACP
jgi:hypothetical protein